MTASSLSVACLNLEALVRFFRSAAFGAELSINTRFRWQEYRDSTVLNVIYALMPWKGHPGMAEVSTDWVMLAQATDLRAKRYLEAFFEKLATGGPAAAGRYAEQMQALGQDARRDVANLFNEAIQINREIIGTTNEGIRRLAVIKFGCAITLAATGCWVALGGAVPLVLAGGMSAGQLAASVGAINLAHGVAGSFIKDGLSWQTAKAVSIEVGKDRLQEYGARGLSAAEAAAAREIGRQSRLMETAERIVQRMNSRLAGNLAAARRAPYGSWIAELNQTKAVAQQKMAAANSTRTLATTGLKTLPLVFFAMDVFNATTELRQTWEQTR